MSRSRRRRRAAGSRIAGSTTRRPPPRGATGGSSPERSAASTSTTKSRSPTASIELRVTRAKPRSAATASRSSAEARAGEGARAQGRLVRPPHGIGQPAPVAFEHLDVGEEVMREEHRLRRLHVRVPWHDRRCVASREADERPLHARGSRRRASDARRLSQRRRSVATWSLRERPVWSLPAIGPIRCRERHLEVEVDVLERRDPTRTVPARMSASSARRPSVRASASASVTQARPAGARRRARSTR